MSNESAVINTCKYMAWTNRNSGRLDFVLAATASPECRIHTIRLWHYTARLGRPYRWRPKRSHRHNNNPTDCCRTYLKLDIAEVLGGFGKPAIVRGVELLVNVEVFQLLRSSSSRPVLHRQPGSPDRKVTSETSLSHLRFLSYLPW